LEQNESDSFTWYYAASPISEFNDIIEDVFDEIQRSNMSKLGEDGEPIYRDDGKVLKGPNYFKPNFKKFFN